MNLKKIVALFVVILSVVPVFSQTGREYFITIMSENISLPFTSYGSVHPGMEVGTKLYSRDKESSAIMLNFYVGGYTHKKIENAIYTRVEYQPSFYLKKIISIDLPMGLGYMHTFYPGEMYELDTNSGEFKTAKQFGRPHALLNVGVGLRFVKSNSLQPYIKQELAVESPFIKYVPLIPHSLLKIGILIKL